MTPYALENLYSEFRSTYVNDPDFVINFYDKNAIFFNNIKQFKDKEELRLYIEMFSKYIEAVYNKGRYNLVIDMIDKHLTFIGTEIGRLNAGEHKNAWYYSLYWNKGMASYNLKDYKMSTPIFKKLVLVDDQNENYKTWLEYSKYGQRKWLTYSVLIFSFLLLMVLIFFGKDIPYKIRMSLNLLGLLLLGGTFSYDYYLKRNLRKRQKAAN